MTNYHKFYNGFKEWYLWYQHTWKEELGEIILTLWNYNKSWKIDIKITCESIETHFDPYGYGKITAQTANNQFRKVLENQTTRSI